MKNSNDMNKADGSRRRVSFPGELGPATVASHTRRGSVYLRTDGHLAVICHDEAELIDPAVGRVDMSIASGVQLGMGLLDGEQATTDSGKMEPEKHRGVIFSAGNELMDPNLPEEKHPKEQIMDSKRSLPKARQPVSKEIFMPRISELLCQDTLLEDYAPMSSWRNKSRKLERRGLSVTSMQHDIEALKQYLGDHMKCKDFLCTFQKTEDEKSTSLCCRVLTNALACCICIPCLIAEFCTREARCRSPKIDIVELKSGSVTIMEDYDYFWDPVDIDEEDRKRYHRLAKAVLVDWLQTRNLESWDKIDKELTEICLNNYSGRLGVWLELYETEGVDVERDMAAQGLRMMQMSFTNGSMDVIFQLVKSGHPIGSSTKFCTGLYKGTTPLHLAIINRSAPATDIILDSDHCYELIHLRAESTPLRDIFPTIELPLNLAVWTGDTNIVRALIEKGAEMCATDQDGNNPFHVVALLAEEDADRAVDMLETLLDLINTWLEHTVESKALMDLSLKKGRLVALHMLFKRDNNNGMTPLKLCAKSGSSVMVQRILSLDKLYRFPLYKLGPKSESLYDFSEIDPLLSHETKTVTMLEMLVYEADDRAIDILGLPQITTLKDIKYQRFQILIAVAILFHVLFMTLHSAAFYVWLLPGMKTAMNATTTMKPVERYNMHVVDIIIFIIGCFYQILFFLGLVSCLQIVRRLGLSAWNTGFVVASLQLPVVGGFALSLILYFILKALQNNNEIFMLSMSMLLGWIHCTYFTRMFRSTSFFALMVHRVLSEDIMRFLSIIGIMMLSFTMMTSALLMTDPELQESDTDGDDITERTKPIPVMFDFFQLGAGIADFTLLQKSSNWFMSGAIYISFLTLVNILLFNLLIASMSNRYALISGNGDLLTTKVMLQDMVIWEWMMPNSLRRSAQSIYEHRIVRVRLNANHYMENHVYLLQAPDPHCYTFPPQLAKRRATVCC